MSSSTCNKLLLNFFRAKGISSVSTPFNQATVSVGTCTTQNRKRNKVFVSFQSRIHSLQNSQNRNKGGFFFCFFCSITTTVTHNHHRFTSTRTNMRWVKRFMDSLSSCRRAESWYFNCSIKRILGSSFFPRSFNKCSNSCLRSSNKNGAIADMGMYPLPVGSYLAIVWIMWIVWVVWTIQ